MQWKQLALGLISVLALQNVIASPLQDISATSVDIQEDSVGFGGNEHLIVTVTRVDDLLDDNGDFLAERVMAVRVNFDVVENQLMCNGKPVDIGVSSIQIEAQIGSNPDKLSISSAEELALLEDQFYLGLVTVEVTASLEDQLTTEDGITFRRINVQERIMEINGENVVQTEAGQQVLDVFESGAIQKWNVDPLTGFLMPGPTTAIQDNISQDDSNLEVFPELIPAEEGNGCLGGFIDPVSEWWTEQDAYFQTAMTASFALLLFGFIAATRKLMLARKHHYEPLQVDEDANAVVDEVIWEEKKAGQADKIAD
jgi:sulfur carrier protein ThiS